MKIWRISKNLNMTDEIKQALNAVMPQIMQNIESIEKNEKNEKGYRKVYPRNIKPVNISFVNPYDKNSKQITMPIFYATSPSDSLEAQHEIFNNNGTVELSIVLKIPEDKNYATKIPGGGYDSTKRIIIPKVPFTKTDVYNILFHEISHSIDPKGIIDHKKGISNSFDQGAQAYYTDPKEIDAFQSEITNSITTSLQTNPNNSNVLMTWLRGNGNLDLNRFLINRNAIGAFNFWSKNNPDILKKLKQRIYNSYEKLPKQNNVK